VWEGVWENFLTRLGGGGIDGIARCPQSLSINRHRNVALEKLDACPIALGDVSPPTGLLFS
jgi:hypothetical protein